MGMDVHDKVRQVDVNFTAKEIEHYKKAFKHFDLDNSGSITFYNLKKLLREEGEAVTDDQLHDLISEVATTKNNAIDLDEFLQVSD
jgi:Ca2+-binding EF-hand superfamily protein